MHASPTVFIAAHNARLCIVLLSLCAASVPIISQADNTMPWAEYAITRHLDRAALEGLDERERLEQLIEHGEMLFSARFTRLDGAGRPMATQAIIPTKRRRMPREEFSRTAGLDANACSSCHHLPVVGGAGDFSANVFVSEGFTHSDFDTVDPQFSNERNTNHLFGAGLVELLAREMSRDLQQLRSDALHQARTSGVAVDQPLNTKGVDFGQITTYPDGSVDTHRIDGVDEDLTIRPFSHKGVMTSLRQFTVNALNHHHGLQAPERFGVRWTGEADYDEDGLANELTDLDVSALVAWQASLPPPVQYLPDHTLWQTAAAQGEQVFERIGCADCHRPWLPLESLRFDDPGPLDTAGTLRTDEGMGNTYDLTHLPWATTLQRDAQGNYKVPLFGDLKRHVIADRQNTTLGNELLAQRFVERNVFMTTELWGVSSTAPYGHRGNLTTLAEVIDAHGGAAKPSGQAWRALSEDERSQIIAWLRSLVILSPEQ